MIDGGDLDYLKEFVPLKSVIQTRKKKKSQTASSVKKRKVKET